MRYRLCAGLCLFLLALPKIGLGREAAVPTVEPEFVTASRFALSSREEPASVFVITSRDIEASGAHSLAEVLSRVPGVFYLPTEGETQEANVRIRGLSTEVLYLIDDIPWSGIDGAPMSRIARGKESGAVDLRSIPLDEIDRIEIVKGAASASNPSSGAAATVQIHTKKASFKETAVTASFGSHDAKEGSFFSSIPGESTNVRLWYVHREEGRSRLLYYNGIPNDNLDFRGDDGGLSLERGFWRFTTDWGSDRSRWEYGTRRSTSAQKDRFERYTLAWERDNRRFSIAYRTQDKDIDEYGFRYPYSDHGWSLKYDQTDILGKGTLRWGLFAQGEAYSNVSSFLRIDGDRREAALFEEWSLPMGEILVDLGLRLESWEVSIGEDQTDLSPKLSLSWQTPGGGLLYGSVGHLFSMPSLYQLNAYCPPMPGATPTSPSPHLKPEKGWHYELGYKGGSFEAPWEIALFYLDLSDRIRLNLEAADGDPTYVNADGFHSWGIEASHTWRLSSLWSWEIAGSWTQAEEKEGALFSWLRCGVPVWSIDSRWNYACGPFSGQIALHHLGDRTDERPRMGRDAWSDVTLVDVSASRQCGDLKVRLSVQNLFDTDYWTDDYLANPAMGLASVKYPGPGRTFWASLEVKL